MPSFANYLEKKQYKAKVTKDAKKREEKRKAKEELEKKLEESISVPRSLVFHKGEVGKKILELEEDFKTFVMMPYTAAKTTVTQTTSASELVKVSKDIGISHLLSFSAGETHTFFRIIRVPNGPTLTFTVEGFTTQNALYHFYADKSTAVADQETPNPILKNSNCNFTLKTPKMTLEPPFLVMSGFDQSNVYHKLLASSIQNMFPEIDVDMFTKSINNENLKLTNRRVLMVSYDQTKDCFEWRHYVVKEKVKFSGSSDFDDETTSTSTSSGMTKRIGLSEVGPRLDVKLHKIEEGVMSGEVLYHSEVKKTAEEVMALRKKKEEKEKRRKQQEKNVEAKKLLKEQEKEEKRKAREKKKQNHQERFENALEDETEEEKSEEDDSGAKNKKRKIFDEKNEKKSQQ